MDAWRMVHPGSDGPEPCPPEYEPMGEGDDQEPDGWWDSLPEQEGDDDVTD